MFDKICLGDPVADSPLGPGQVTGITDAGYPQVNHVAVAWCRLTDGATFDPYNKVGGSCQAPNLNDVPVRN